jgi:hypothetical protein
MAKKTENIKISSPKSQRVKNTFTAQNFVLDDIHKKIIGSAALNGGFDILMFKIEKIEQNQEQLVGKVDKIHDAIYDPDDGIFSKISDSNAKNSQKINETEQKLVELSGWKKQKEKESEKSELELEETSEKVQIIQKNVDDLVKSKNTISSAVRWVLVALTGGSLTLLFKWIETKF